MRALLLLSLCACAHAAPPPHEIRVAVPVFIRQDCEAINFVEKCKADCLERKPPAQAYGAIEGITDYRCICGPFTP